MRQGDHVDDGASATKPKFYLPAGPAGSLLAGRLERVWTALFNHRVDGSV